jgi:hypothetical protein
VRVAAVGLAAEATSDLRVGSGGSAPVREGGAFVVILDNEGRTVTCRRRPLLSHTLEWDATS